MGYSYITSALIWEHFIEIGVPLVKGGFATRSKVKRTNIGLGTFKRILIPFDRNSMIYKRNRFGGISYEELFNFIYLNLFNATLYINKRNFVKW